MIIIAIVIVIFMLILGGFIIVYTILPHSKNKALIFRTKFKSGYTEGILLNISIQEKPYISSVNISSNNLYAYVLSKDPKYIEKINIVPYEYSKQNKKKMLQFLSIEHSSFLYSRLRKRNQL